MTPDWLLLRRYVKENSQEAFATLTGRYLNLVYAVCLRETHDPDLAQDATQAVFLLLARTAPAFRSHSALPGWLFRTARFAAQNARTRETRRRYYERKAADAMQQQNGAAEDAAWPEIAPLLNQSLAALREADRQCVLLRFFQGLSFAESGAALGVSEEAARKRVGRALEKMRGFLTKEGVVISGASLAALLAANALTAAPAQLVGEMTKMLAGLVPGHVSLIAQGASQTMKIFKLKVAAGAAALLVAGAATYTLVHSASAKTPAATVLSLDTPVDVDKSGFPAPGKRDAVRNAVLSGKVRYEDGRPAGGIQIGAQLQNRALLEQDVAVRKRLGMAADGIVPKEVQEESWNNAVSKPDGSYELPVATNLRYNVMAFDTTGKWVGAAIEGAVGKKKTAALPDLILTRGALIIGTVSHNGRPVAGLFVGNYGPHRPASSAACSAAKTDASGHYVLRVTPGGNRVYIASGAGNTSHSIDVAAGEIASVDFPD